MSLILDLINQIMEEKTSESIDTFNKLMEEKMLASIDEKKQEVAGEISEISKATLGSYIKQASDRNAGHNYIAGYMQGYPTGDPAYERKHKLLADKRAKGISRAVDKLTKESLDESFMKSHTVDGSRLGNAVAAHKQATEVAKDSGGKLTKINSLHHEVDFGGGHTATIKTVDNGGKIKSHVVHRSASGFKESLDEGAHYHSVWVKPKGDDTWSHHFDADNKEDAADEARSCRNNGEKVKVLRVHKDEADWRKPGHRAKAIARLNEETEE